MNYFRLTILAIVLILLFRYLRVLASIPLYKKYWEGLASQQPTASSFKLVVLGDSVAQGIGATRPAWGYAGRLIKAIEKSTAKSVYVANLSLTRGRLKNIFPQIEQLKKLQIRPDLIILEVGANDMKFFEATDFAADYKKILDSLPANLIVADIPPLGGSSAKNAIVANKIIHRLCSERSITIVPIHQVILQNHSLLNISGDFFHPGNRGHKVWFGAFWATIKDRLNF